MRGLPAMATIPTDQPKRRVRDELAPPKTCSVRAAEVMTSLSRGTLKYLKDGTLESIKVGKRRLIYVASIDKMLGIAQ
jgi:hypothetical protein